MFDLRVVHHLEMRRTLHSPLALVASMVAFSLLAASIVSAQTPAATPAEPQATPTPPIKTPEWRCITPGGTYAVALKSMVCVAIQEYIVDGGARVTEVNIDTMGNSLARFYYLEPITPQSPAAVGQSALNKLQELATQASERTGQEETWKKVVKSYPTSTHAHTIEYRVDSADDLQKIFKSADTALRSAVDTEITLK